MPPASKPRMIVRLHWRIWLAVMAAVLLATVAASGLMHYFGESQRTPRVVQIRNGAGEVVAETEALGPRPGRKMQLPMRTEDGQYLEIVWLRADGADGHRLTPQARAAGKLLTWGRFWPPRGWQGLVFWLSLLAVAIGLGAYPVARRMSQRLQALQASVEAWGDGQLQARASVTGADEVGCLAQRFNQAASRIESLLLSHQTLLANTSHELRTPLTRLRMAVSLVAGEAMDAEHRAEIERNIDELDALVEDLLLRSRLEAAAPDRLPLLHSVDMLGLAVQESARFGVEVDPEAVNYSVLGDERLLQRLIRNLLQNAQRYGGADADGIAVVLRPAAQAGWLWLEVLDRGPGVPESLREKVFEPFFRLGNASEQDGGVGLGLALVQSIARHHGGEVQCLPREGGGSCFRLALPVQPSVE